MGMINLLKLIAEILPVAAAIIMVGPIIKGMIRSSHEETQREYEPDHPL